MSLQGKVAIVTGASSGIGQAIAKALVECGANVTFAARRESELMQAVEKVNHEAAQGSGKAFAVVTDVVKREQFKNCVEKTEKEFGAPVDILVNCAGVMYFTLMKNIHEDEWERTIDVNCKGVTNGIGSVLKKMVDRGCGHIVNISSDASKRTFPCLAVYCASKTFVDVLSEGLRRELVGSGVRVTVIQPGDVKTNLVMTNSDQEAADKMGVKIGEVVGSGWSDANNVLEPKDIADAVVYAVTAPAHVAVNEILIEPRDQS